MRVLQLIDSLRPGGAERMAVSYANALARRGQESFLCCTRMEGLLKKKVEPGVGYLFLEKKSALDHRAFIKLKNFVKNHRIQIIQAHSSSYFLAVLVKWALPGVKIIWHDHYGRALEERKDIVLKLMSRYFDGIISVNEALKAWAKEHLKVENVVFFKNFLPDSLSSFEISNMTGSDIKLRGNHSKKIICVANLRPQKDHFTLIKAFELVLKEFPDVSLHLVGRDGEDAYSRKLKEYIYEHDLKKYIYLYGEQENIQILLKQANIAVLSSATEGLPVALLEYGMAEKPVVSTEVGEVKNVINGNGSLVPSNCAISFAEAVKHYLRDEAAAQKCAKAFHGEIVGNFSETAILPRVSSYYEFVVNN